MRVFDLKGPLSLANVPSRGRGRPCSARRNQSSPRPRHPFRDSRSQRWRQRCPHKALARLELPTGGSYSIGGENLSGLPGSVTGRNLGYVGNPAYIFQGSLRDNLLLGVMHRPVSTATLDAEAEAERSRATMEAEMSGNITKLPA